MRPIKVIIVDDNKMYRESLKMMLSRYKNISIVAEASSGDEFTNILNDKNNDVILMDIDMPEMNGIEATAYAVNLNPFIKIIALSFHKDEKYVNRMINAGAKGFVFKDMDDKNIYKAIETVHTEGYYFCNEVLSIL